MSGAPSSASCARWLTRLRSSHHSSPPPRRCSPPSAHVDTTVALARGRSVRKGGEVRVSASRWRGARRGRERARGREREVIVSGTGWVHSTARPLHARAPRNPRASALDSLELRRAPRGRATHPLTLTSQGGDPPVLDDEERDETRVRDVAQE